MAFPDNETRHARSLTPVPPLPKGEGYGSALRKFHVKLGCAALLAAALVSSQVQAEQFSTLSIELHAGNGNSRTGQRKVQSENCQECHGLSGVGLAPSAPKLTGQYADYLIKQLEDFQSGARKHPVMTVMAESLSDDDRADITAWYGSNKPMQSGNSPASLTARDLFTRGDVTRNVLPCKSCHGEGGRGSFSANGSTPAIGGQHMIYLREQLRNWRSGVRHNSPDNVMNIIAKSLSDSEIESLADYISEL
jgi:cytochrome c553